MNNSNKEVFKDYFPFIVTRQALNESRARTGGRPHMRGLIQRAETQNANGRIYPKRILEREVTNYRDKYVATRRSLGELDHPIDAANDRDDPLVVRLDRASHMITNITMEGNDVYADVMILSTPHGKILESLFEDGVLLGISSRGFGSCVKENGNIVVQDDVQISCWDYVWMPSTGGAFMRGINESAFIAKPVEYNIDSNSAKKIQTFENEVNNQVANSYNDKAKRDLEDLISALKKG